MKRLIIIFIYLFLCSNAWAGGYLAGPVRDNGNFGSDNLTARNATLSGYASVGTGDNATIYLGTGGESIQTKNNGAIYILGGAVRSVTTVTSNYTVLNSDYIIHSSPTFGGTITLPSTRIDKEIHCIKNSAELDYSYTTVSGNGKNMDDFSSIILSRDESIVVQWSDTYDAWQILSYYKIKRPTRHSSATPQALASDTVIYLVNTGTAIVLKLPLSTALYENQIMTIKAINASAKIDANGVLLEGADHTGAGDEYDLSEDAFITIQYTATYGWRIIG